VQGEHRKRRVHHIVLHRRVAAGSLQFGFFLFSFLFQIYHPGLIHEVRKKEQKQEQKQEQEQEKEKEQKQKQEGGLTMVGRVERRRVEKVLKIFIFGGKVVVAAGDLREKEQL